MKRAIKAEQTSHPNRVISQALFYQAISEIKQKIADGEYRQAVTKEDWEAKLPPLKHNPEFPWITPVQEKKKEEIKLVAVEVKKKEVVAATVPTKEVALVGAGSSSKQLTLW